jgi:hypothetical protein
MQQHKTYEVGGYTTDDSASRIKEAGDSIVDSSVVMMGLLPGCMFACYCFTPYLTYREKVLTASQKPKKDIG